MPAFSPAVRPIALAFLLLAGTASPSTSASQDRGGGATITGRAVVTDGDTLRINGQAIRLHGIDAPEMNTPEGRLARRALEELVAGRTLQCRDTGGRTYQRIVAVCLLNGADIGMVMVEQGWALDAPRFSRGGYAAAQREAARRGRGIHGRSF